MVKLGLFKKKKQPANTRKIQVVNFEHTDKGSVTNGVITGISVETLQEISKEFK